MMGKNLLGLLALGLALPAFAQQSPPATTPSGRPRTENSAPQENFASQATMDSVLTKLRDHLNVNLLLRSSLEVPDGGQQRQAGVQLNEGRVEVRGDMLPNLSYRLRFRMNRSLAATSQDNASASIDHFSATYRFGSHQNWNLTVGKQSAMVGSWEFDTNPTFEYQYSEFVGRQLNLFTTAVKLAYDVNDNYTLALQVHNTNNETFASTRQSAGYAANGLQPAKLPLGLYVSWLGNLFDKKLQTFYSYNISQFAANKPSHQVVIGNKVVLNRLQGYLDLGYTNYGVEYFTIASPAVNAYRASLQPAAAPVFAENLRYKNAILRLDYEFIPRWFISGKGIWESASQRNGDELGNDFRTHLGGLVALEYQPIKSQDLKLFTYYYHTRVSFADALARTSPNTRQNLFAIGLLYIVNAF